MKKHALLLLATLVLVPHSAKADNEQIPSIDISAEASVKATPDIADISAGVVTTAPTAAAALEANAKSMTAVFKALKDAGIEDKDIQTSGLSVNPQYNYEEKKAPTITSYQAVNNVSVVFRDLKSTGKIIDTLVSQGANQINGPTFSVDKPEAALDQARVEAITKAKKRAELYAQAAGVKIKRILSISENFNSGMPPIRPMMMRAEKAMDMAASSPIAAGNVNLSVTVNIRFELAE